MVLSLDSPLFFTQLFSLASLLDDKQIFVTSGSIPGLAAGHFSDFTTDGPAQILHALEWLRFIYVGQF